MNPWIGNQPLEFSPRLFSCPDGAMALFLSEFRP